MDDSPPTEDVPEKARVATGTSSGRLVGPCCPHPHRVAHLCGRQGQRTRFAGPEG